MMVRVFHVFNAGDEAASFIGLLGLEYFLSLLSVWF